MKQDRYIKTGIQKHRFTSLSNIPIVVRPRDVLRMAGFRARPVSNIRVVFAYSYFSGGREPLGRGMPNDTAARGF